MLIYIIGFSISTAILAISYKFKKKSKWFLYFVALLIPCIIAGCRASSIGTDVQVYLEPITNAAIDSNDIQQYMNSKWIPSWKYNYVYEYEIGFTLTVYITAKIFKSIYAVQFVLQVLTVFPLFIASLRVNKNDKLIWLSMLTYYLMLFCTSLNLMRQTIAMAFLFLAYSYFEQNKTIKSLISFVVAILFHISALVGLFILFAKIFVNKKSKVRIGQAIKVNASSFNAFLIVLVALIVILSSNLLSTILSVLGLSEYSGYVIGNLAFMPNQIVVRLPAIILTIYALKFTKDKNEFNFLILMLCMDLLCSQFTSVSSFGGRVAMYFSQFEIITFPKIYASTKKNKVVLLLIIGYLIFYWWFYFVYSGANQTVPYEFGLIFS